MGIKRFASLKLKMQSSDNRLNDLPYERGDGMHAFGYQRREWNVGHNSWSIINPDLTLSIWFKEDRNILHCSDAFHVEMVYKIQRCPSLMYTLVKFH